MGLLEIVDFHLRTGRYLLDDAAYDGSVLYLETSEELPSAAYVRYLLMCLGERGLLQRFDGLLMGRARAWRFGTGNDEQFRETTCGSRPRRCCPRWRSTARTSPSCSTSTSATPTRSRCCRTAARSGSTRPPRSVSVRY